MQALARRYPFPTGRLTGSDQLMDTAFPGTACARLIAVLDRVDKIPQANLDADWDLIVRPTLLAAGGLKHLSNVTGHGFNDDNHCDLTTMLGSVQSETNADGAVAQISRQNQLGPHIQLASLAIVSEVTGATNNADQEGGSWTTCTNGAHMTPPSDVAHVQFRSRIAFKLVWAPPTFETFALVDDIGRLLKTGRPTGQLPHLSMRERNYALVKGGIYARAVDEMTAA
ncbi:unnamed protein product [Amoebophrya sp. A25]|nr:unnamed protein product [Amoebophrya sp. A25]|eukprot:GSA25T00001435001.1